MEAAKQVEEETAMAAETARKLGEERLASSKVVASEAGSTAAAAQAHKKYIYQGMSIAAARLHRQVQYDLEQGAKEMAEDEAYTKARRRR